MPMKKDFCLACSIYKKMPENKSICRDCELHLPGKLHRIVHAQQEPYADFFVFAAIVDDTEGSCLYLKVTGRSPFDGFVWVHWFNPSGYFSWEHCSEERKDEILEMSTKIVSALNMLLTSFAQSLRNHVVEKTKLDFARHMLAICNLNSFEITKEGEMV